MGCDFLGCLLIFVFSIEREEMEVDCFVEREGGMEVGCAFFKDFSLQE